MAEFYFNFNFCPKYDCRGFSGKHKIFVKPQIGLNPSSVNTKKF